MWNTDVLWFDAAIVLALFAVGNILFGHFEEHRPKWRRLLKVVIVLTVVLGLSTTVGLKKPSHLSYVCFDTKPTYAAKPSGSTPTG